jgi:hypothetical protein
MFYQPNTPLVDLGRSQQHLPRTRSAPCCCGCRLQCDNGIIPALRSYKSAPHPRVLTVHSLPLPLCPIYIVSMKLFSINTTCVLALFGGAASQATSFNITAISAANNASRLECWQLAAPPVFGRAAVNFALGDIEGAFVGIIPPNTTAGTIANTERIQ